MTKAELDHLTELEARATPGPWDYQRVDVSMWELHGPLPGEENAGTWSEDEGDSATGDRYLQLLLALRNAAPALIEAARELAPWRDLYGPRENFYSKLQADNEGLRAQLPVQQKANEDLAGLLVGETILREKAQAENAKLRELLQESLVQGYGGAREKDGRYRTFCQCWKCAKSAYKIEDIEHSADCEIAAALGEL